MAIHAPLLCLRDAIYRELGIVVSEIDEARVEGRGSAKNGEGVCAEPMDSVDLKKRPGMEVGRRLMLVAVAAFCVFAEPGLARGQYGTAEQELVSISVEPLGRSARFRVLFRFEPSSEPYRGHFSMNTPPRAFRATHLGGLHVDHDISKLRFFGVGSGIRRRYRRSVGIDFSVQGMHDEGAGPDARTVAVEFIADIDVSFGFGTTSFEVPRIWCRGERCIREVSYEASDGECLGDFVVDGGRCVKRDAGDDYATIVRRSWTHIWALLGLTMVLFFGMLMIQRRRRRELLLRYPIVPEKVVVSKLHSHNYRTSRFRSDLVLLDAELHSDVERWLGNAVQWGLWLLPIPWVAVWYAPSWIPSVAVGGIAAAFVLICVWRRTRSLEVVEPGVFRVWVVALVLLGAVTAAPFVIDYVQAYTRKVVLYGICSVPILMYINRVIRPLLIGGLPSDNDKSPGSAVRRNGQADDDQWDEFDSSEGSDSGGDLDSGGDFDPPDFDD